MAQKSCCLSKKILGKKLDGEWVFLNLENGTYYSLNETGSIVWDEIKDKKDIESVLDRLEEIYRVDRARLRSDVETLIKSLKEEKLLGTADPLP